MQIAAAVTLDVLVMVLAYLYYVYTSTAATNPYGYGDYPPESVIFFIRMLTEPLVNRPLWAILAVTSLYLLWTDGLRQICAYLGPMAVSAALILRLYEDLEPINFWLELL